MAKVTGPLMSLAASGSIGRALNFTSNASGAVVRAKKQSQKTTLDERRYYRLYSISVATIISFILFHDFRVESPGTPGLWSQYWTKLTTARQLRSDLWAHATGGSIHSRYLVYGGPFGIVSQAFFESENYPDRWEGINENTWHLPTDTVPVVIVDNTYLPLPMPRYVMMMAAVYLIRRTGFEIPAPNFYPPQIYDVVRYSPDFTKRGGQRLIAPYRSTN